MRGWVVGVCVALCLAAAPSVAHREKRTDPCGCHHQWGLRHCHPKQKTVRCEAPAKSDAKRTTERKPESKRAQSVDL